MPYMSSIKDNIKSSAMMVLERLGDAACLVFEWVESNSHQVGTLFIGASFTYVASEALDSYVKGLTSCVLFWLGLRMLDYSIFTSHIHPLMKEMRAIRALLNINVKISQRNNNGQH